MANSVETSSSPLALLAESVGLLTVAFFSPAGCIAGTTTRSFRWSPQAWGYRWNPPSSRPMRWCLAAPWPSPRDLPAPAAQRHGDLRQWLAAQRV